MNTIRFLNLDCVQLKNDALELLITQSVGPRIIRLSFTGDENILAELPDLAIDCPGQSEKMNFFGGHRLGYAPQVPVNWDQSAGILFLLFPLRSLTPIIRQ